MGKLKERMLELIDRLDELEQAKEKVEDVLYYIEDAEQSLPNDYAGPHHSQMEWEETLAQIETEIEEIRRKIE